MKINTLFAKYFLIKLVDFFAYFSLGVVIAQIILYLIG